MSRKRRNGHKPACSAPAPHTDEKPPYEVGQTVTLTRSVSGHDLLKRGTQLLGGSIVKIEQVHAKVKDTYLVQDGAGNIAWVGPGEIVPWDGQLDFLALFMKGEEVVKNSVLEECVSAKGGR